MSVRIGSLGQRLWNGMRKGEKRRWRSVALGGGRVALGAVLGAAKLFSGCGPFGIAMVAAAGPETKGLLYLAGVTVGYLAAGGISSGTRYIATTLLVFTVGFVTRNVPFRKNRAFMPAVTAAVTAMTGAMYLYGSAVTAETVTRAFAEVVLGGGCCCFFGYVTDPEPSAGEAAELRRNISTAILCVVAAMGAAGVKPVGGLSLGHVLAMLGVMSVAFCGGGTPGCAAGVALGLGMDLSASGGLYYTAAYGCAGLLSGCFFRYGRAAFVSLFCAANAVAVLLGQGESAGVSLFESILAALTFLLLPRRALVPVGEFLRVGRGRGETAFRLYMADRMKQLAEGFQELYESAAEPDKTVGDRRDVSTVFDRTADTMCRDCAGKIRCWREEGTQTVQELEAISGKLSGNGVLRTEDLPSSFRARCILPEGFVSVVNGELRGQMYRKRYEARLRECRSAASGQLADMANVLRTGAGEMSGSAGPDRLAERKLIRFLKARQSEGTCSAFRDEAGRLHAVIEGAPLSEDTELLEQLSEVLNVRLCMENTAETGRIVLRQAEPLAASVGIASMKKDGETVSGDWGTFFKTDRGMLCVVLSDGMGTGKRAAEESASSVDILRRLLLAGVEPECAMRMLNGAALLRNGEEWGYATVDLCCIDLFTGQTDFYKYGAAPSYVKTPRGVRRVKCGSLAAGMLSGEAAAPDRVRMNLKAGNIALIASDGVLAERKDQWIRDILLRSGDADTKELARSVLRTAAERFGNMDDMTALAVRIERRE